MANLNKVISALVFLLAVVSLAFAVLLFQRRTELRQRGEKLADAVADVVKEMDTLSGTAYVKKLHRNNVAGADGQMMAGGTLGWAYFHTLKNPDTGTYDEFERLMKAFKTQSRDVRDQRDELAQAIVDVSEIMEKADVEKTALTNVVDKSYAEPVNQVKGYLKDVHTRDETVFSKIEESALAISHPMAKDSLKDLENYETPLSEYVGNVRKLHTRTGNYADTLAQISNIVDEHEFEFDPDRIKDEDAYAAELDTILKDYSNINDSLKEYERNKVELEETKDQLEKNVTALEDANENVARLETKQANLEADLAMAKQKIARLTRTGGGADEQVVGRVGKVVKVNYDWNYVIVNLGAEDQLLPNVRGVIAREREFICRGRITQVLQKYSVMEILPDMRQGTVVEGDRVIF